MHKQVKHTTIKLAIAGALALMHGSLAMATTVTLPNIFEAFTPATAESVNANFSAVKTAVDDNDGRITTNEADISTNTTGVSTNAAGIAANVTDIDAIGLDLGALTSDFDALDSSVFTNATDIADHETRITTLEGATGVVAPSTADNPVIAVDCTTDSLQAAIETAPLHGKTLITISGACSDDIFLRRSNITIRGLTGPGSDSISGNSSGFSSDPNDGYDFSESNALEQRNLAAAIEMEQQADVVLQDLTISAGTNSSAVKAARNSSLTLVNVTLNGGENGVGLHAHNSDIRITASTVTGNGTNANSLYAGAAVLAEANSVMEIQTGNTFTGGSGELTGFVALSNTTLRLTGGSNVFNPGPAILEGDEPIAFELAQSSTLAQTSAAAGNQINGDIDVNSGSHVFLSSMTINAIFFEIFDASSVILEPDTLGAISVTVSNSFEIGGGSTLDIGDDGTPVTINFDGLQGTMRLLDHASLLMFSGSLVNMDLKVFRNSSVDAGNASVIGGNLDISNFSSYVSSGHAFAGDSVLGFTTCGNAEANVLGAPPTFTFLENLCTGGG